MCREIGGGVLLATLYKHCIVSGVSYIRPTMLLLLPVPGYIVIGRAGWLVSQLTSDGQKLT